MHCDICYNAQGNKFGIKVTHPDFVAGRALILAADSADAQKSWLQALQDCSRVTMQNALLGDSMIENLRAQGTSAEKEKAEAMQKLQDAAMEIKKEQEEKVSILANQDNILKEAAQIEVSGGESMSACVSRRCVGGKPTRKM